jgi:hypothetical protein
VGGRQRPACGRERIADEVRRDAVPGASRRFAFGGFPPGPFARLARREFSGGRLRGFAR